MGWKLGTSMQHKCLHLPLHLISPRADNKLFEQIVFVYVKWMVFGGAVGIIIIARAVRKHSDWLSIQRLAFWRHSIWVSRIISPAPTTCIAPSRKTVSFSVCCIFKCVMEAASLESSHSERLPAGWLHRTCTWCSLSLGDFVVLLVCSLLLK